MTEIRKYLARQLRQARKQQSFSQEKLAELTGLSTAFISALERATANPTLDTLEKLSAALQVPLAVLLDADDVIFNEKHLRKTLADKLTKMNAEQLKLMLSLSRLTAP